MSEVRSIFRLAASEDDGELAAVIFIAVSIPLLILAYIVIAVFGFMWLGPLFLWVWLGVIPSMGMVAWFKYLIRKATEREHK